MFPAQFTGLGETSARQAIELTEYFLDHFAVDPHRVYGCGYSAGGGNHVPSGFHAPPIFTPLISTALLNGTASLFLLQKDMLPSIFLWRKTMSITVLKRRDAYDGLYGAYRALGWNDGQIAEVLQLEIPDNEYF